jgi:hypothetical protein
VRRIGFSLLRLGFRVLLVALAMSAGEATRTADAQQSGPPAPVGTEASLEAPFVRRQIFVGLPNSQHSSGGQLYLAPNVNVGSVVETGPVPGQFQYRPTPLADDVTSQVLQANSEAGNLLSAAPGDPQAGPGLGGPGLSGGEVLPGPDGVFTPGESTPIFNDIMQHPTQKPITGWRAWLLANTSNGPGLGRERLAFAPFEIDTAAPNPNIRARVVSVSGGQYPDRSEYLWARSVTGRGPKLAESNLDYQEARFLMELGSKKFSLGTEIPFRFTNPERNPNHTSISDMNLATKLVMVDGKTWQITQLFRSFFPTGSPSMGLGNGHVAFEPGFLMRYNHCDRVYWHGEIKYYFPVGGDPTFQGQLLTYGLGFSKVWLEGDSWSVVPVMEFVGHYVANGRRTEPTGVVTDAEGDHIMALYPGIRVARDRGSDLGLFEWGISTGLPITSPKFYDSILRIDVRWGF